MVMQVPAERAMPASMSFHCWIVMLPASFSAQYFQTSEPEPRMLPPKWPRIIGPAGMKMIGRFMLMPPMMVPGVVLSQPPISTAPSTGCWRSSSSTSMRQEVAVEHGGGLDEVLGERHRRQLDREAARLPDAALDVLHAGREVRVARVDVAPGIDDADDGLAHEVVAVVAHLQHARAMAERAQIGRPEPALASQVLKCFPRHDVSHPVAGVRARGRSAWVGDGQQARGGRLSISGWRSLAVHALDRACGPHGPEDRHEGVGSQDHQGAVGSAHAFGSRRAPRHASS